MSTVQQISLERGVELFNEQRYFEAHEEWEEEWRLMPEGEDKTFFQGLIFAAAAFLHYTRRECAGAKELLNQCFSSLRIAMAERTGINVEEFLQDLGRLREVFGSCRFELDERGLPIIQRM